MNFDVDDSDVDVKRNVYDDEGEKSLTRGANGKGEQRFVICLQHLVDELAKVSFCISSEIPLHIYRT